MRLGFVSSRRAAREILEDGKVTVNGRRCAKSTLVEPTDRVEVAAPPGKLTIVPDPSIAIDILHVDAAMVVVNKPGAIPCYPIRTHPSGTVMNALAARFPETAELGDKPGEGGLVHRLDNGTSGALMVARSAASLAILRRALRAGEISRRYLALVAGRVAYPIDLARPIAHHPKNPRKMMIGNAASLDPRRRGRAAATHVEPVRRVGRDYTLVEVTPHSGSRHQIRVHLADAGLPIVGDTLYQGPVAPELMEGRFWLHLNQIALDSPAAGPITVDAPVPAELVAMIERSRGSAR